MFWCAVVATFTAGCGPSTQLRQHPHPIPLDGGAGDGAPASACDRDGDGFEGTYYDAAESRCAGDDCDDANAAVHPGAEDLVGDAISQDCDPVDGLDGDRDFYASAESGGGDCDDTDSSIHPKAPEVFGDGIDQDCDGADTPDADGDGHAPLGAGGDDCDDGDDGIFGGAEGDWTFEVVPGVGGANEPSMAVDPAGAVHIVYSSADLEIRHATDASGDWVVASIDFDWGGLSFPSIEIGPDGVIHVTYSTDADPTENRYARDDGAGWVLETIGPSNGSPVALALDGSGVPHVLLSDDSLDVRHGWRSGGVWTYETVQRGIGGRESGTSLAIDPAGVVHAAYDDGGGFTYHRGEAGVWTAQDIDDRDSRGTIAVDPTGAVHAVYQYSWSELRHATNASGLWEVETVEDDAGDSASFAMDSAGALHVAYFRPGLGGLRYSSGTTGAWTSESVAAFGRYYCALTLDSAGRPVIGYFDDVDDLFRVARRGPADGVDDDCDGVAW